MVMPDTVNIETAVRQLNAPAPAARSVLSVSQHQIVSDYISSCLPAASDTLYKPAQHHFERPGKQYRAILALSAGDCFGVDRSVSLPWAAAVELLHNASLVHDDICDGDRYRRGVSSVWARFGQNTALALGDWLIAASFAQASQAGIHAGSTSLVPILARHMADTTSGQAGEFTITSYPDWTDYMTVSTAKTAPLFIAPVEGMAVLGERNELIAPLRRFFTALGGCYQIANDMMNVRGCDGAASPASDLVRRAPNAVIVMFRQTLDTPNMDAFNSWLSRGDSSEAGYWQDLLNRSPALEMTAAALMNMMEEAELSCAALPHDCQAIIAPIEAKLRDICAKLTL